MKNHGVIAELDATVEDFSNVLEDGRKELEQQLGYDVRIPPADFLAETTNGGQVWVLHGSTDFDNATVKVNLLPSE